MFNSEDIVHIVMESAYSYGTLRLRENIACLPGQFPMCKGSLHICWCEPSQGSIDRIQVNKHDPGSRKHHGTNID